MTTQLCPAQQRAFDALSAGLSAGNVFVLSGDNGMGKTTVLSQLQQTIGGKLLTIKDVVEATRQQHPLAVEEAFEQLLMNALQEHDVVLLDDLQLIHGVFGCCHFYPRQGWITAPLKALTTYAAAAGKKLIFGNNGDVPTTVSLRCYHFTIPEFKPADYEFLAHAYFGDAAAALDCRKIHRFAPKLNAHQWKAACHWLRREGGIDTERFIDYLRTQRMASNVNLGEVQDVRLDELKGIEDVLQSLEANIILPLERDDLAAELHLKPKRGVLLAGPPGTGKTTVGRALAHRLQSKFFLLDGTFVSGTQHFYQRIHELFEAAKQNGPSILFIDDSDVIFESGEELGLYRYLLTMLDGLESESMGRVCVMMTAMDVSHLPPALIRSGRIELWLEMRLPEEEARAEILSQGLATLPPALGGDVDVPRLASATAGFTGADLKRLIEDGKNLFAYDRARRLPPQPLTDYFLAAVETVRANKERYAQAEVRARQQRPQRPVYFDGVG